MMDWSAEVYYKDLDHVYDYMDGCTMFSKLNLESIILGGEGVINPKCPYICEFTPYVSILRR